ncbi:MAG: lipopolysaccharide heptosyltransferase II [Pirellulaceae bacterium]|nr:lipopolysaccharide heptosyltransferase II [Pirellulaceae bacterium]
MTLPAVVDIVRGTLARQMRVNLSLVDLSLGHASKARIHNKVAAPMKLGVILPNWIGDAAMATPALRSLSEQFGSSATIVGIMRPYVSEVLDGTPWLQERIFYNPKSNDKNQTSWSLIRRLRQMRLDTMVLLPNSLRTGAIAWLSGARERIGYARNGRGALLTNGLKPLRTGRAYTPVSAVDYYLELARVLGCQSVARTLELSTTGENERAADRAWKNLGLPDNAKVVAICPAGAFGAAKHWPAEQFAELGRRIAEAEDCHVVVTCGPAERNTANQIASLAADRRVVSLAQQSLSIGLTKACIRRAQLVITTDSGPRHLAAGFQIPTVALFGSTDPRWSINYNPCEIRLHEDLPCAPCAKRICPLKHHRCMRDLAVTRVLGAGQQLLHPSGGSSQAA